MNSKPVASSVQLVFDRTTLVAILTSPESETSPALQVLNMVRQGEIEGWYSQQTILAVYDQLEKSLAAQGGETATARQLMKGLFELLKPLPQNGDEALEIERQPGDDLQGLLIGKLACDYLPNPLIVTDDQWLLNHSDLPTARPQEILDKGAAACQPDGIGAMNFIDLAAQQRAVRPAIDRAINTVLNHGRYILGPEVQEFEEKLADFVGVKHCIGVSSGTDALLMVLMAKGIGPGDAVFTTPFTFIATAEIISLLGATPVFVDIDPLTYNIDPAKLEKAIQAVRTNDSSLHPVPALPGHCTSLTPKAIIPVDLFGLPADYDPIMEIARKEGLFVLEDAAQGLGGVYKGRVAGGLGHAGATSFFPAKPLGCYGDGGAVLTDDDELAALSRSIRVHGKGTDKYDNIRIGLNARLHTMQAAILLAKLAIFPQELEARQEVADRYTEQLAPLGLGLILPTVPEDLASAWAQYSILTESPEARTAMQQRAKELGIPTMVYYPTPLHIQTAFKGLGYKEEDFPISITSSRQIFSLPMHPYLDVQQVTDLLKG